jgi:hypothetical protein
MALNNLFRSFRVMAENPPPAPARAAGKFTPAAPVMSAAEFTSRLDQLESLAGLAAGNEKAAPATRLAILRAAVGLPYARFSPSAAHASLSEIESRLRGQGGAAPAAPASVAPAPAVIAQARPPAPANLKLDLARAIGAANAVFGAGFTAAVLAGDGQCSDALKQKLEDADAIVEGAERLYGPNSPAADAAIQDRVRIREQIKAEGAGTDADKLQRICRAFSDAGLPLPIAKAPAGFAHRRASSPLKGRSLEDATANLAAFNALCDNPLACLNAAQNPITKAAAEFHLAAGTMQKDYFGRLSVEADRLCPQSLSSPAPAAHRESSTTQVSTLREVLEMPSELRQFTRITRSDFDALSLDERGKVIAAGCRVVDQYSQT